MNVSAPHLDAAEIATVPLQADLVIAGAEEYGVVLVKSGVPSARCFADFMSTLGKPMFTEGETPVPELPNLNIITNVGRTTKPKSVFHSDTTYVPRPPSFSGLYAVDVPASGGATMFTDQYAAYDALPATLKELLVGATMVHTASGVGNGADATVSAQHPVVRKHHGTGRLAVFLTTPARCSRLRLQDGTDRSDLIRVLYEHSLTCWSYRRHVWKKGDVLVWDNRCTLHAADHSHVVGDRTLYRALVQGEVPT